MAKRRKDGDDGVKLSFEARLALKGERRNSGHPLMSRDEFAELTGVSHSLIVKRDRREVALMKGAESLYQLILDLANEEPAMMSDVIEALAAIPKTERSEERSLGALIDLASRAGKGHVVRWALGDDGAEKEGGGGLAAETLVTVRNIDRIKKSLRRAAKDADGEDARFLADIAADLARIHEKLEMFAEDKGEEEGGK